MMRQCLRLHGDSVDSVRKDAIGPIAPSPPTRGVTVATSDNQANTSQTRVYAGIFFVLMIMATNLAFSVAPESIRNYVTRSLRSPNGEAIRGVLHRFPALRSVARTAVMDAESFV